MQVPDYHHIEILLTILTIVVVLLGVLAKRLEIPYPIIMVIGGLAISFVPGIPKVSLHPELVFLVFLPPLLLDAAARTSWRDFRHNLSTILFLAFGLVAFTVFGVALLANMLLPGFDLAIGLVLGAVLATTDAVAATSIAKRIGLPTQITNILEGESLVNDASGLLALEFAVGAIVSGHVPSLSEGLFRLATIVIGGVIVGLAVGKVVHFFEVQVDYAPVEIAVSIITPFVAYLLAEALHTSGILAVVTCGLYLGRHIATFYSSSVRIEAYAVWNALTFVLNGLVFVLIGLQLPYVVNGIKQIGTQQLLTSAAMLCIGLVAIRLLWIYPSATLGFFLRRHLLHQTDERISWRGAFVVGWTGMRGVIALAAAVSLPDKLANGTPFPQKNIIIFLTFSAIFVTLVVQGLMLPPLIRRLGLAGSSQHEEEEERKAKRKMFEAALTHIDEERQGVPESSAVFFDQAAKFYQQRLAALDENYTDADVDPKDYKRLRKLSRRLRDVERNTAIGLRNENKINDEVLRKVQRDLDLLDARDVGGGLH